MISRILKALTPSEFRLDHVLKCSEALSLLDKEHYDLILLDNRLSDRVSAKFSVPLIKAANQDTPIAVISNDVTPGYLQDKAKLGVDHIIDKSDMVDFFRTQLSRLTGKRGQGETQSA